MADQQTDIDNLVALNDSLKGEIDIRDQAIQELERRLACGETDSVIFDKKI